MYEAETSIIPITAPIPKMATHLPIIPGPSQVTIRPMIWMRSPTATRFQALELKAFPSDMRPALPVKVPVSITNAEN